MSDDITQPGVPFSLVCMYCDDGMHIDSYEQAIAEGWSDISYESHILMANLLRVCPDCRNDEGNPSKPQDPELQTRAPDGSEPPDARLNTDAIGITN